MHWKPNISFSCYNKDSSFQCLVLTHRCINVKNHTSKLNLTTGKFSDICLWSNSWKNGFKVANLDWDMTQYKPLGNQACNSLYGRPQGSLRKTLSSIYAGNLAQNRLMTKKTWLYFWPIKEFLCFLLKQSLVAHPLSWAKIQGSDKMASV